MIALVEGAERQKTPNEIALNILLAADDHLLLAVGDPTPFAIYSGSPQTVFVLVSLLVCLIPTTIGGLLSAIALPAWIACPGTMCSRCLSLGRGSGDVNTLLLGQDGHNHLGQSSGGTIHSGSRR